MIKDPHDTREFRQWVSLDDQGNVIAVHEFAATTEQPLPEIVEVTEIGPKQDWNRVDPKVLAPIRLEHQILVAETAAAEIIAAEKGTR